MRKISSILITALSLLLLVASLQVGGSGAYFSDVQTATMTIQSGAWNSPPTVTVIYPNGGEVWYVWETVTIKWNATDPDGDLPLTIDIDFSSDSGENYSYHIDTIEQNNQGDNEYEWTVPWDPDLISDNCRIKITATDPGGLNGWDESDEDFCPHLPPPPEVKVVSPNVGESWHLGEICPITWNADGVCPSMMVIDIYLSPDGGVSWFQITANEENDGVYDWAIPFDVPTSDEARIKIIAAYPFDVRGQDDSDESFGLCEAAPEPASTPDEETTPGEEAAPDEEATSNEEADADEEANPDE